MAPKGQKPKSKTLPRDLLEALRDLGGGIGSDIQDQTGLRPRKISETVLPENQKPELQEIFERRFCQAEIVRKQERIVFSAKDQESKTKVAALQEEVKKLASATQNLAKEVKIAAVQTPVEPGVYHETFFEKLISFIKSLTRKIEDASVWLAAWNARAKKRPFYWAQVQKSGTKFMLSQERYMATQAG
ncbi:MAG: DUF5660 family protein [Patescibacteria group bacterium]